MQQLLANTFLQDHAYADMALPLLNAPSNPAEGGVSDHLLLKLLRELRDSLARKHKTKPYLIFPESKLEEMAVTYPLTLEALAKLAHIGVTKARKFGEPFLQLIQRYVTENNIEPSTLTVASAPAKYQQRLNIIQHIDKKLDLDEIVNRLGISREELIQELERIQQSGVRLYLDHYIDQLLDHEARKEVFDYFKSIPEDNLEQALDELGDVYTEEEIRLLHLAFLYEMNP